MQGNCTVEKVNLVSFTAHYSEETILTAVPAAFTARCSHSAGAAFPLGGGELEKDQAHLGPLDAEDVHFMAG